MQFHLCLQRQLHIAFNGRYRAVIVSKKIGQVWTPSLVADEMVKRLAPYISPSSTILDPCSGPGTFAKAVIRNNLKFESMHCFEIDPVLVKQSQQSVPDKRIQFAMQDFLSSRVPVISKYDAAILNPPYVRHELIPQEEKKRLRSKYHFGGKANLYTYFLLETAQQLKPGGVMCAIIYKSLVHTNYGSVVTDRLQELGQFTHRVDAPDVFPDAIVDAEVIIWRKYSDEETNTKFKVSSKHAHTSTAVKAEVRISDVVDVQRGTSFPSRKSFVTLNKPDDLRVDPILTKQKYAGLIAHANAYTRFRSADPEVDTQVFQDLVENLPIITNISKSRLPKKVTGKVVFNYFIRNDTRHLLNLNETPVSDNFYCAKFETPEDAIVFWCIMNTDYCKRKLLEESRPQGNGLRKLQLFEYARVRIPDFRKFPKRSINQIVSIGTRVIDDNLGAEALNEGVSNILRKLGYE